MPILLRRVVLRNYKSIGHCKIDLGPLSILVGPNGAGKSNFIDALRLVGDALNATLDHAFRQRGGIGEVRRRSGGHPTHFAISLRTDLASGINGAFAFQVGALPNGGFEVQQEQASVSNGGLEPAFYKVRRGKVVAASEHLKQPPATVANRLFLTAASGDSTFRRLFDALSTMGFYNINPVAIREPQPHDTGQSLRPDGANVAAVLRRLRTERPAAFARIKDYLRRIVPGIEAVDYKDLGPRETLEFRQKVEKTRQAWRFYASAMSDGTLRSLGVLAALFQGRGGEAGPAALVAIEEPEATIHPGAASIVMDALLEASRHEQVIAATHSPDLLDHSAIDAASLIAVRGMDGETEIAPIDKAAKRAVQDQLHTAGDLLRKDRLAPDSAKLDLQIKEDDLFEKLPGAVDDRGSSRQPRSRRGRIVDISGT
ncbi:MAG: AAA family ATPase [Pseudomonadota bacterium]